MKILYKIGFVIAGCIGILIELIFLTIINAGIWIGNKMALWMSQNNKLRTIR
jgi:hypothetical protein